MVFIFFQLGFPRLLRRRTKTWSSFASSAFHINCVDANGRGGGWCPNKVKSILENKKRTKGPPGLNLATLGNFSAKHHYKVKFNLYGKCWLEVLRSLSFKVENTQTDLPGLHLASLANFPAIVQILVSVPEIQVLHTNINTNPFSNINSDCSPNTLFHGLSTGEPDGHVWMHSPHVRGVFAKRPWSRCDQDSSSEKGGLALSGLDLLSCESSLSSCTYHIAAIE